MGILYGAIVSTEGNNLISILVRMNLVVRELILGVTCLVLLLRRNDSGPGVVIPIVS